MKDTAAIMLCILHSALRQLTLTGLTVVPVNTSDCSKSIRHFDSFNLTCIITMNCNDYLNAVKLTEQLALENYEQRNGVVDYRLPGVCNHYMATYDLNGKRNGELCLSCTVSKTIGGQLRYTFKINSERVAYKNLYHKFRQLGAFNDQLYVPALV
jgi:hypothetical protein